MILPYWAELVGFNAALLVSAPLVFVLSIIFSCSFVTRFRLPVTQEGGGANGRLGPSFSLFFFF